MKIKINTTSIILRIIIFVSFWFSVIASIIKIFNDKFFSTWNYILIGWTIFVIAIIYLEELK